MDNFHQPSQQLNYLLLSLSQDKSRIGFLLSAGCPYSIKIPYEGITKFKSLVPNITELTDIVINEIRESNNGENFTKILSHISETDSNKINIEKILSHIRSLIQIIGKESFRGVSKEQLEKIEADICSIIVQNVNQNLPSDSVFHSFASWVNAISREYPLEIFTTNYDLLIEQALESQNVPFFDGFIGSHTTFFDNSAIEDNSIPSRWIRLWKLHGSINWFLTSQNSLTRSSNGINTDQLCRVIHPSHLKYTESRKMPYLAMFDRFKNFLKTPHSLLFICGYSFHDEHINDAIITCLRNNPTSMVFGLVFGDISEYSEAIDIALMIPNFSLIASNEGIIGKKRGVWAEKVDSESLLFYKEIIGKMETERKVNDNYHQVRFDIGDFNIFIELLSILNNPTNNPI